MHALLLFIQLPEYKKIDVYHRELVGRFQCLTKDEDFSLVMKDRTIFNQSKSLIFNNLFNIPI